MKLFSLIIFCLFSLISSPISANEPVWRGWDKIKILYPAQNGLTLIMNTVPSTYSTCEDGRRYILLPTTPNYEVIASGLMSAFYMNKTINLATDPATTNCAAVINRVQIVHS